MPEEQVASAEQVQEGTTPSGETPPKPGVEPSPTPQPLTEERIQQLIAEGASKFIEQGKEVGRREMQSIKDREVAEVQRRQRLAEEETNVYKSSFSGLDEETQRDIELKRARSQVQFYQSAEQQETLRRQHEAYAQQLNAQLDAHLESLGIDKTDKRVDRAQDALDYLSGRSRFDASVARIIKENAKAAEVKWTSSFKEMERKLRKELGLDSVDATISGGIGSGSDADFVEKVGSGEIKLDTKANLARARKLGLM